MVEQRRQIVGLASCAAHRGTAAEALGQEEAPEEALEVVLVGYAEVHTTTVTRRRRNRMISLLAEGELGPHMRVPPECLAHHCSYTGHIRHPPPLCDAGLPWWEEVAAVVLRGAYPQTGGAAEGLGLEGAAGRPSEALRRESGVLQQQETVVMLRPRGSTRAGAP